MRIVAGSNKGARIRAPKGRSTRPTGDRAREATFGLIGPVGGAAALDLYAGSGAMGLEALSRGAGSCVFVESNRAACAVIEENIRHLRASGTAVRCADAFRVLADEQRARRAFDLVFADPPYEAWDEIEGRLADAVGPVLAGDGLLVVETSSRVEPALGLDLVTSRRYGSARITLFRR